MLSYHLNSESKIVYLDQPDIADDDVIWGLLELGYDNLSRPEFRVSDAEYTEQDLTTVLQAVADADLVITKDFSAVTAEACYQSEIPYLSWVHDSPQRSLYMKEAMYETNLVFVFDKKQLARMRELGIPHVFHMPLAANVTRTSQIHIEDEDIRKYASDISFVGNLYESAERDRFFSAISADARDEAEQIISSKVGFWDDRHTIYNPISASSLLSMQEHFSTDGLDQYRMSPEFAIQIAVLAREAAMRERITALNMLAGRFQVSLYTSNPDYAAPLLPDVRVHGRVTYREETPLVFFSSKINLNLTVPTIETGAPLRVFDIMSVGGFVMSNYQEELAELFVPDQELVLFADFDDMVEKCDYYLRHERERLRIAMNGYRKLKEKYTYPIALSRMFDMISSSSSPSR